MFMHQPQRYWIERGPFIWFSFICVMMGKVNAVYCTCHIPLREQWCYQSCHGPRQKIQRERDKERDSERDWGREGIIWTFIYRQHSAIRISWVNDNHLKKFFMLWDSCSGLFIITSKCCYKVFIAFKFTNCVCWYLFKCSCLFIETFCFSVAYRVSVFCEVFFETFLNMRLE